MVGVKEEMMGKGNAKEREETGVVSRNVATRAPKFVLLP